MPFSNLDISQSDSRVLDKDKLRKVEIAISDGNSRDRDHKEIRFAQS